ncbi:MAG TPA: PLP-dependent cysteine synthase family protein [Gemmatimonadales bacterium]
MLSAALDRRLLGLKTLIGNTPLLAVEFALRGSTRVIYAKAEHLNLTGSVKDRMALHILHEALERGTLEPEGLIVEATSGNTGIAFAALGRTLGHRVAIFMPDWMSEERKNLIRSYGAEVYLVSAADGGFQGSIEQAEALAAVTPGAFLPRQFANQDNSAAHEATTGPEIWSQLQAHGVTPAAFVAGVGTGGTLMGTGRFLRSVQPAVKLHPVEPASSPTLSTGHKVGRHRIQGVSDEFIPPIVDLGFLDQVLAVDDGDAILMAQKLARELGLAVGISSGANFLGAALAQQQLGAAAPVATLFPDDNKKYLSTDLLRQEPVRGGYLSPEIELRSFRSFGRVCRMCVDAVTIDRLAQAEIALARP